ncbi:Plasmid stabilization system protein ParE [Algoriphagus locisalis]|uniref:Plasmid stabilization system protein ParE n=2 Tax=Algoriphagus locisalis TaxID=305507 RepID=A0A1I6ZV64_9BACT|nr:Plasmid stabilization system protein ParE [Algoriphagus locisalis]
MMKKASLSLSFIQKYLVNNFGVSTSRKFVQRLDNILVLLCENPEIGRIYSKERGIYSFVLQKQVILFYRFDASNFIILEIFDVRRNPENWP